MLIAWIKVWMAVTNLTHSRQKVDVCRLVWFSVRSLLCKSFWADSVDFQAEAKMRRLLSESGEFLSESKKQFLRKLKRFSVRNLNVQVSGKIGQELVRKSSGFRSGQKMFRVWASPCDFWSEIWICKFFGKIGEFFGEISAKSGIWMNCSHRSHYVCTTCFFSRLFVRTDVRTFRTCSHHVRTPAVGQRVCARLERNLHKSREINSFRLAHPRIFEFFAKTKPWPTENEQIGMFLVICTVYFVFKLKILQPSWWFCLKNLLANLNWTFQSFPIKQQRVFQIESFTYVALKLNIKRSWWLCLENRSTSSNQKGFRAFRNNNRQHAFQIVFSNILFWIEIFTQSGVVDFHVLNV